MLHIPQKDIEWYTRRPGYYEMVQENLKKLNDTLGDIDMTGIYGSGKIPYCQKALTSKGNGRYGNPEENVKDNGWCIAQGH